MHKDFQGSSKYTKHYLRVRESSISSSGLIVFEVRSPDSDVAKGAVYVDKATISSIIEFLKEFVGEEVTTSVPSDISVKDNEVNVNGVQFEFGD